MLKIEWIGPGIYGVVYLGVKVVMFYLSLHMCNSLFLSTSGWASLIDFNGISTRPRHYHTERLRNYIHCMFIEFVFWGGVFCFVLFLLCFCFCFVLFFCLFVVLFCLFAHASIKYQWFLNRSIWLWDWTTIEGIRDNQVVFHTSHIFKTEFWQSNAV